MWIVEETNSSLSFLLFFCGIFTVVVLIYYDPIQVNICIWCKDWGSLFFHMDSQVPGPLLKSLFTLLNWLHSFVKNQLTINVQVHFWPFYMVSLICMSVLRQTPNSFYCRFQILKSSTVYLLKFFKIVLVILITLPWILELVCQFL